MITVLKKINQIYHLRKDDEIRIDDTFFYDAHETDNKVKRKVTEILEQRTERGIFNGSKKPGYFARVNQEPV